LKHLQHGQSGPAKRWEGDANHFCYYTVAS